MEVLRYLRRSQIVHYRINEATTVFTEISNGVKIHIALIALLVYLQPIL
jgi:hypothetical protein